MRKTSESGNISIHDLTVDTAGLMQLMHVGRQTATEVGIAAKAKNSYWKPCFMECIQNKKYLDDISEGKITNEQI